MLRDRIANEIGGCSEPSDDCPKSAKNCRECHALTILAMFKEEVEKCRLSDNEIRRHYLGSRLSVVKDVLDSQIQAVLGRLV